MALLHCEFKGKAIGKDSGMDVIVPEGMGRGPWPVLYLLHGLSDNHTAWQRRTSLERYVSGLGLIVVMPDGHRSFYVNAPTGGAGLAYEDHMVQDVVGFVDATFPTRPERAGRAVAGLSMGGYGAFMLALKNPDVFSVGVSHSGALAFGHKPRDGATGPHDHILGETPRGGPYDCFALAERLVGRDDRPALRFDCGVEDFLLEHNRAFREHLEQLGYPAEYAEHPGAHNWAYWDEHIRQTLDFVVRHLQVSRVQG